MPFTRLDYEAVCCLFGTGLSDRAIARRHTSVERLSSGSGLLGSADRQRSSVSADLERDPGRDANHLPGRPVGTSPRGRRVGHPARRPPRDGTCIPPHGPGRKHLRKIVLEDWQFELTPANRDALVRGLIHSDGCRCVNSFRTALPSGRIAEYSYVRYFFTNHSADIRCIFREHCQLLGVRVTQPSCRSLAVSHRDSIAILERLIGPKS